MNIPESLLVVVDVVVVLVVIYLIYRVSFVVLVMLREGYTACHLPMLIVISGHGLLI